MIACGAICHGAAWGFWIAVIILTVKISMVPTGRR
jgi:hypothetical protein